MHHLIALALMSLAPTPASAYLPRQLSNVYSYQCETHFLEGEGMGPHDYRCTPFQRLGEIQTNYGFYLFASQRENNFSRRGRDTFYGAPLCGYRAPRAVCSRSRTEPEFGLSRVRDGIYNTAIHMMAGPGEPQEIYGYAAAPRIDGSCPAGLAAAWVYQAQPESIQYPLTSNFWNENGSLDQYLVRGENGQMPTMDVYRRPNLQPCDGRGDCSRALIGEAELAQSVPYVQSSQQFCVVPKEMIAPVPQL